MHLVHTFRTCKYLSLKYVFEQRDNVVRSNPDLTKCLEKALDTSNSSIDVKITSSGCMMFLMILHAVCETDLASSVADLDVFSSLSPMAFFPH